MTGGAPAEDLAAALRRTLGYSASAAELAEVAALLEATADLPAHCLFTAPACDYDPRRSGGCEE